VLRSKKAGDTVKFDVRRSGGQAQSLTITLEPFDHGKLLSVTPARVGG
jgi:PDZ domain-containing secreted protein